jgi:hypothetical protein
MLETLDTSVSQEYVPLEMAFDIIEHRSDGVEGE